MKRGFCQRRQDSGRPAVSGNMPFFPLAALLLVFGFRSSLFPVWRGLSSAHKLHVELLVCSWPRWWWCPVLGERAEPMSVTARSTRACLASPSLLVVIKLVQMVSFWIKKIWIFLVKRVQFCMGVLSTARNQSNIWQWLICSEGFIQSFYLQCKALLPHACCSVDVQRWL